MPDGPMLTRLYRALPWDGSGWQIYPSSDLSTMRAAAARDWRRRFPAPLRPFLWAGGRLGWSVAALDKTLHFARALRLDRSTTWRLYRDCLLSGAAPIDAHVWRALFSDRHPLPGRAAQLVFRGLGSPAGHALLSNKLALAERLSELGIAVPTVRAVPRRGSLATEEMLDEAGTGAGLFVKPLHGAGGRGAFALARIDGVLHMDGVAVDTTAVVGRMNRLLKNDDLLVQDRLTAADDLADLARDGRAPVLRLATARAPGAVPFLHSAMLMLPRPGRDPRHFLDGMIHAPIDPAAGRIFAGISLADPRTRLQRREQDGPVLANRAVPDFADAVALALRAMAGVPPLALIHWDIILSPAGPVFLEGNTAGNWILASLPGLFGLDAGPLAPTLAQWAKPPDHSA